MAGKRRGSTASGGLRVVLADGDAEQRTADYQRRFDSLKALADHYSLDSVAQLIRMIADGKLRVVPVHMAAKIEEAR